MGMQAYLDPAYAAAMACGELTLILPRSAGLLITRSIPGTTATDAAAPYPFLLCRDWAGLAVDIADIGESLVTITAVTDPFAQIDENDLRRCFNHVVRPYKAQFVVALDRRLKDFADPHHLGCARRALKRISVERCPEPLKHMADWLRLYAVLVRRHGIRGANLMTEESFRRQFAVNGPCHARGFDGRHRRVR
jgi:hypothetical protein